MSDDLIRIPPIFRRGIESSLGRPVVLSDQRSIQDLRQVSPSIVEDLKRISEENDFSFAERYLRYLTSKANHPYLFDFISDVVLGGRDASSWLSNVIVYVNFGTGIYKNVESIKSLLDLLCEFSRNYNGILGEIPLVYSSQPWDVNRTGCPCVLVTNFNYRDSPGAPLAISEFDISVFTKSDKLETLMFRYLMASIARCVSTELRDAGADEVVIKAKYLKNSGLESMTPLLQTALDVLLKEREILNCVYSDESAPGYCVDESYFIDLLDIS